MSFNLPWGKATALAAVAFVLSTQTAQATSYGGWTAHATADGWHDDNLARGLALDTTALPNGNQDFGVHLGLTVGNVWVVTPELDTWLIADAHGSVGVLYPSLDDMWAALSSNTVWHLSPSREAYGLANTTVFINNGAYYAGEVGLVQALWFGASARAEVGAGAYATETTGASFVMPSAGVGLDQAFFTNTTVGLRYAFQALFYTSSPTPRHQLLLRVGQPLGHGLEVHASYLETIDTSSSAGFFEGYLGGGVAYDL